MTSSTECKPSEWDTGSKCEDHRFYSHSFKHASDFKVSIRGQDIDFWEPITALGICIDENLTFDIHVNNICLKASRQISASQRLTGLLDLPSRKAIYNSFIVSDFYYCPLVCFFRSRASITKIQKLRDRTLRFVLKDSIFYHDTLLSKGGVDSFRISSLKTMAVEICKILTGMNPECLSPLFSRSTTPYSLRDNNKLIQPIKRTTTYGIKSLAYYGMHFWNLLPLDVKGAITLNNFKTLMENGRAQRAVVQYVTWSFRFLNLLYKLCVYGHCALVHECTCLHVYMRVVYVNTCMYLLYVLPPLFISICRYCSLTTTIYIFYLIIMMVY